MAAPSAIRWGAGVRDFQIFVLDSNGFPAATTTAAYLGIDVSGVRDVTINDPAPRVVTQFGDDRIGGVDLLPPTDTLTAEARVSKLNNTLDAALTGNNFITLGEMNVLGVNTDLKGNENQVGIVTYQQAQDSDPASSTFGVRYWEGKILPKAWMIPRENPMNENATEITYTVQPTLTKAHLWGTQFTAAAEGYTEAQLVRVTTVNKPRFVAFKADGSTTTFAYTLTAVSTSKIGVVDNGVVQTSGYTASTTSVTFSSAPTSGHILVVKLEVANTSADNA